MSLRVPVSLEPLRGVVAEGGGGLRIPLGLGLGQRPMTARQVQVLRAVAAAAALNDPGAALTRAKEAHDDPAAALEVDAERLVPVLRAVTDVQDDRSGAPAASELHQAVARSVGADAVLAATAEAEVKRSAEAAENALKWVASIDPELLERAARAAARIQQFELIPDTPSRLERIEPKLQELEGRVEKLEKRRRGPS